MSKTLPATPSPRAVLWDLDGTLCDSGDSHWLAWLATMNELGIAITRDQFDQTFGRRNDTILADWLGPGATPADIDRVGLQKEANYRRILQSAGIKLLPGARDWLDELRLRGWRQALATSAPKQNVEVILTALEISTYFDAVVQSEDVRIGKPDPEVFLMAAKRLATPVDACIVIEDSSAGIEAARRAGMRCIAVGPLHASLPADVSSESLLDISPAMCADLLARNPN